MHADRGIGGTGAAGGKGDAGPPGHGAVRRRHERRAALLPADHGLDGVVAALVMQGIEHGEEAFARHGENTVAALNAELVDKDLAASAGHKGLRCFTVVHSGSHCPDAFSSPRANRPPWRANRLEKGKRRVMRSGVTEEFLQGKGGGEGAASPSPSPPAVKPSAYPFAGGRSGPPSAIIFL